MKNSVEDNAPLDGAMVAVRHNGRSNGYKNDNERRPKEVRSSCFLEFWQSLADLPEAEQERFLAKAIAMGPRRMLAVVESAPIRFLRSGIRVRGSRQGFDARRFFCEQGASYWIGKTFEQHVLSRIHGPSRIPSIVLSAHAVSKAMHDSGIMESLGVRKGSCECMSPSEIAWTVSALTSMPEYRESGVVPAGENSMVVGYIECEDGKMRGVGVSLNRERCSPIWECTCIEPANRGAGDIVLCVDSRACEGQ